MDERANDGRQGEPEQEGREGVREAGEGVIAVAPIAVVAHGVKAVDGGITGGLEVGVGGEGGAIFLCEKGCVHNVISA